MKSSILKLIARIEDMSSEDVSLKDVRVLAQCESPEAIDALAGLLDDEGRVGKEAARGLKRFGRAAEGALRRCLGSHNDVVARKAAALLAGLGDDAALRENEVIDEENEAAAVVAEAEPENDNDEIPAVELKWLTDQEVVRAIRKMLFRRGVAPGDLDDGVADVQTRILEMLRVGPPPSGLSEWTALAMTVAKHFAFDEGRKRVVRNALEEPLEDESEAYVEEDGRDEDPVDAKRLLAVLGDLLEAGQVPPLSSEILCLAAEGYTDPEIAERLGVTKDVVRKRRHVARRRMRWELASRGMAELDPGDEEAACRDDEALPASRGAAPSR
jgi:RNA polymerase sigma factor (sigma-70 family)